MSNSVLNKLPKKLSDITGAAKEQNDKLVTTAVSATRDLVDIHAKYAGVALESGVELVDFIVTNGEKQYRTMTDIDLRDVKDYTTKQKALLKDASEQLGEIAKEGLQTAKEARVDYTEWFKKSFNAPKKATKKPAKKAAAKRKPAAKKAA